MIERREFIQQAAASLAAVGTLGADVTALIPRGQRSVPRQANWDLSWATRLTGTHKAVFDVVETESGFGVYRAAAWASQYIDVLKATRADLSPVVVLRSHAVVFALRQDFWDRYEVGRTKHVTHPASLQETSKNPVLLEESDGIPAALANGGLRRQIERGVTVLACNLALESWVEAIRTRRKTSDAEARAEAIAALVPGVMLQPSGVFAATYAQQHGCVYLRAS